MKQASRLGLFLALCTLSVSSPTYTHLLQGPSLSAQGAILVDAHTDQILYGVQITKEFYPASITKIMTAYLAIVHGWNKTGPRTENRAPGTGNGW